MSSTFGNNIRITVFGQSHSPAIGAVIDGLPAGLHPDMERVAAFTARRAPGSGTIATARKEADEAVILSGMKDGFTCDAPLAFYINNTNTRPDDYSGFENVPRPSHSDRGSYVHSGGFADLSGGGHFSGRLTAPLCFAGALLIQFLESKGIYVGAHCASVGSVKDRRFAPEDLTPSVFDTLDGEDLPFLDREAGVRARKEILDARAAGDSVGGVVECAVAGMPEGRGSPMFDTVEGRLAKLLFAVPAVKGVDFGSGFDGSALRGSQNNDVYVAKDPTRTGSNNAGGALGGLTTGMPVLFRAAFKPTASIAQAQQTLDFSKSELTELVIHGRHDPCIVPRAVPVVEAAAAFVCADILLDKRKED